MATQLLVVVKNHDKANELVQKLLKNSIDKYAISVIAKGKDDFELDKENQDIATWGKLGAGWGAIIGLLVGAFASFVPGFGPIVAAGPVISSLAGAVGGATVVGGLSAVTAWLVDIGIEEMEAKEYEKYLKDGYSIVIIEGKDALKAKELVENDDNIEQVKFYKES